MGVCCAVGFAPTPVRTRSTAALFPGSFSKKKNPVLHHAEMFLRKWMCTLKQQKQKKRRKGSEGEVAERAEKYSRVVRTGGGGGRDEDVVALLLWRRSRFLPRLVAFMNPLFLVFVWFVLFFLSFFYIPLLIGVSSCGCLYLAVISWEAWEHP
jgi:hypothetical protein